VGLVFVPFLCLLMILASASFGQSAGTLAGQVIQPAPPTGTGGPAPFALVRVCPYTALGVPCSPLALLYSDPGLTQSVPNPFTTDNYGNYSFYLAAGFYIIQITVATSSPPTVIYSYTEATAAGGITVQTNGVNNANQSLLNLVSGSNVTIVNTSGGIDTISSAYPIFQTNTVNNLSQATLNLTNGANVTLTNGSLGNVSIASAYPTFQTNGVNNSSQALLNIVQGTNITVTNTSGGVVTISGPAGFACSPVVNNAVLFFNGSGSCTSVGGLAYNNVIANYLTIGNSSVNGGLLIRGTTATSTQGVSLASTPNGSIGVLQGSGGWGIQFDIDSSTTPVVYNRLQSGIISGGTVTLNSQGLEWTGQGDVQGSGSAAGFKVTNLPSTTSASAGASNSITAGNAQGTGSSPGGSNTITAGSASGGGSSDNGGSNSLIAGNGSGTSGIGGDITLTSGNGAGTGRGGNINFNTGTGSPAGQFLCNGNPCFPPSIQIASLTTNTGTSIGASATTWITKAITMPSSGGPFRVLASYGMFFSAGASGTLVCWIDDNNGSGNVFATGSALTNTSGGHAMSCSGTSVSPVTYANGATVTFVGRGDTDASGGVTVTLAQFGSTQSSWLSLEVLSSN
jgi:hypothetical protein